MRESTAAGGDSDQQRTLPCLLNLNLTRGERQTAMFDENLTISIITSILVLIEMIICGSNFY